MVENPPFAEGLLYVCKVSVKHKLGYIALG
jgi:hypothetical protein